MLTFDAFSQSAGASTNDFSWSHVPVGTPSAVVVTIIQNQGVTDEVLGVTYGGVAMAEITPDSPFLHALGAEDGSIYAYFLDSGIPPGTQTVQIDVDGAGSSKRAGAVSVLADAAVEIADTQTSEQSTGTTHSVILSTPAGVETLILGSLHCGGTNANTTEPVDHTLLAEQTYTGAQTAQWTRKTTNATGGSVQIDWTTSINEESGMFGIALREAGGSSTKLAMVI